MANVFLGEKEPKPVSGRVKEIAEFMLSCVMEKIVRKEEDTSAIQVLFVYLSNARSLPHRPRALRFISVILHYRNRRSQWRVAVTGATSRARFGGGFEAGIPGGWCSMLSGRPH